MKKITNKLLKAFGLYLVSGSDLRELKKKTHLIGGHTFAAYGSFYMQDIIQAKEFSDKSKEAIEDLVSDFEDIIHYR